MEWRLEARHVVWSGVLEEGMQYGVASWRKACSVEWHPGAGVAVWSLEYGIQYGVATLRVASWRKACGMEWRFGARHVVWRLEEGMQCGAATSSKANSRVVAPWSMAVEPSGSPIITLLMIYIIQRPLL